MTEPNSEQPEASASWLWQFYVAVGLLVGFAGLVIAMILLSKGDETLWQRRVFVFGAVEAVVFTAVGWLFGREVSRAAVKSAIDDANRSKEAADEARGETRDALAQAAHSEVRAAEEHARGEAVRAAARHLANTPRQADGPHDVGAGPHEVPGGFAAFVEDLYGHPSN